MDDLDTTLRLDEDVHRDHVRVAGEFLGSDVNKHAIEKMLRSNERRLIVNIDEVRAFNRDFATGVLDEPNEYIPAFEEALRERILNLADPLKHQQIHDKPFYIGLRGSFGDHHVNPRTMRSAESDPDMEGRKNEKDHKRNINARTSRANPDESSWRIHQRALRFITGNTWAINLNDQNGYRNEGTSESI